MLSRMCTVRFASRFAALVLLACCIGWPAAAFGSSCFTTSRYQTTPSSALSELLLLVSGPLGLALMAICITVGLATFLLDKSVTANGQRTHAHLLIAAAVVIYLARLGISFWYTCDTARLSDSLGAALDVSLSIVFGGILLCLPCFLIGEWLGRRLLGAQNGDSTLQMPNTSFVLLTISFALLGWVGAVSMLLSLGAGLANRHQLSNSYPANDNSLQVRINQLKQALTCSLLIGLLLAEIKVSLFDFRSVFSTQQWQNYD